MSSFSAGSSRGFGKLTKFTTPPGQQAYTTPGTYTWIAPAGITSVCAVAIGGGGGGGFDCGGAGGGLSYGNFMSVIPGSSYTVVVGAGGSVGSRNINTFAITWGSKGGNSSFLTLLATGGGTWLSDSDRTNNVAISGGSGSGGTAGYSGGGGTPNATYKYTSGGGAAGYSGNGGTMGSITNSGYSSPSPSGSGGGGGAGACAADTAAGGGGVGIFGEGSSGSGGTMVTSPYYVAAGGGGGSGGSPGQEAKGFQGGATPAYYNGAGGSYGGGGGKLEYHPTNTILYGRPGAGGAVRIIWGPGRQFPSTNTGDV